MYAIDQGLVADRLGGPIAGGEIATTVLPPTSRVTPKFDLYGRGRQQGRRAKAKDALKACGKPDGFSTNIAYRADRPKEKATAEALQQSLKQGRHQAHPQAATRRQYFSELRGVPRT